MLAAGDGKGYQNISIWAEKRMRPGCTRLLLSKQKNPRRQHTPGIIHETFQKILFQIFVIPVQHPIDEIQLMGPFPKSVGFPGVNHQFRGNIADGQRAV